MKDVFLRTRRVSPDLRMGCVAGDVFLLSQSRYTLGSVTGLVYFKRRCHSQTERFSINLCSDRSTKEHSILLYPGSIPLNTKLVTGSRSP